MDNMNKILIVDSTPYKNELKSFFLAEGYKVDISETAFDAIAMLSSEDYSLVVSEVDLPGDNSFEFYYYLKKNIPFMPVIMLTTKNIDNLMEKIFREGIGNVLTKPINKEELASLSQKIISKKNLFGLENYITNIKSLKKIKITSSSQILPAIKAIIDQIASWKFPIDNVLTLNLILNEMIINAVYHSYGYTEEKLKRIPVKLKEGQMVDITFGFSNTKLGISITDYNGTLSKDKILHNFFATISQKKLILEAFENGDDITDKISETGRGLDLVRQIADEYFFVIQKNKRTDVNLLFSKGHKSEENKNAPLKIIEIL